MIKYKPLGNRVIVKQLELTKEERVINGIEAVDSAIPLRKGVVVFAGIGEYATATGVLIPMELKEGDVVKFLAEAAYVPLRIGNEEYKLFREQQIECVVEDK